MHSKFISWCDDHASECLAQQRILAADSRKDEAAFMQIRANVYGIFRAVYTAMNGDLARVKEKLTSIPAAWEESLRRAEAHGETEKAHVERIKLETVHAIRHYIDQMEAKTHD